MSTMMIDFLRKLWYDYKEWRYKRKVMKYFGIKPTKLYVSQADYDALQAAINSPPNPKVQEQLQKLFDRTSPWNYQKKNIKSFIEQYVTIRLMVLTLMDKIIILVHQCLTKSFLSSILKNKNNLPNHD